LITEDNIVKVMDFGIAKVLDSHTITNSNKIIGTAHYFSPEQAKGSFVDGRTDIYSLGILMYEMVTGKVPYNAESSLSIAMMHIAEPVIAPKKVVLDLPDNINVTILKAIEKDPINRFQSAKEMTEVLSAIKEDTNFLVNLNNKLKDATKIMEPLVVSDGSNDFTRVMNEAAAKEEQMAKSYIQVIRENKSPSINKRIIIATASIFLIVLVAVLGKYISKSSTTDIPTSIIKTDEKLPVVEKKLVPSLIGSTESIAKQIIVDNGFLLGNVSNEYNDNVAKGVVIGQTPKVNTAYEKNAKIELIISKGKKIVQVTVPELTGKTVDEAESILNGLKLKLGVASQVEQGNGNSKGKKSKGKKSKNSREEIFIQSRDAGTLVDIGTAINVSYYED
jgi:eukaryotic-like serine/threonine-protein kinase